MSTENPGNIIANCLNLKAICRGLPRDYRTGRPRFLLARSLLGFSSGEESVELMFSIASLASRTQVAKAQYDWTSVVIALLIALGLVGGFFVVQVVNDWLHGLFSKTRHRTPSSAPSNGNSDVSSH
jgi:hypothetical protein